MATTHNPKVAGSKYAALNIPVEMVHYDVTKLAQLGVARGLISDIPVQGTSVSHRRLG